MLKSKYKYNPDLLSYDRIRISLKRVLVKAFTFLTASLAIIVASYILLSSFFDMPRERVLLRELNQMTSHYDQLDRKLKQLEAVLGDMQQRDDNIYRTVFEAEPIPQAVRVGFGGVNRYKVMEDYSNAELMTEINRRINQIARQAAVQSEMYDELLQEARKQGEELLTRPAIQPVENRDLQRTASGYGEKIHPIYGTKFFHKGMDFTAPIGTKIYATGDGTVAECGVSAGFGNRVVIDHGHGYRTLYAHMDKFAVKAGNKVKRGQVIGTVGGNTGVSIGPHLHYEVHKNGKAVNPINYYYSDLSPEEYALMLDLANVGKTFD
ncbi:MAG: M23 family metallopeptidase [Bacteroidales bacterium]|jgi:murein DD-endopeptidase MepM/ murein hydrolase activator NlpD|nr:M23 family metallopeptidase [Bacteroidales bacterium]